MSTKNRNGNWLSRLERRVGRFAIPNLTLLLVGLFAIGFVISLINPALVDVLQLKPGAVLHGQVWRLFTFMVVPPNSDAITFIIMLFFYASIGREMERAWGATRYTLYILSGYLFTAVGSFVAYGVVYLLGGPVIAMYVSVNLQYVLWSLFLAYALTFPDMQILLYFIIPIKVKWLAYVYYIFIAYSIFVYIKAIIFSGQIFCVGFIISIVASILNFILFYLGMKKATRLSPAQRRRKADYRRKVKQNSNSNMKVIHVCSVCGRNSEQNPELQFRYCSKCNGNYEYCEEHLFTHQHVK